jgi:D-amino-acid dehydrogenase
VQVRTAALPQLLSWAPRFLRNSSQARFIATLRRNVSLALLSATLHRELEREIGFQPDSAGENQLGSLHLHQSPESVASGRGWARLLEEFGVTSQSLTREETLGRESALKQMSSALCGSHHYPQDQVVDPRKLCTRLATELAKRGTDFRYGCTIVDLPVKDDRLIGARDSDGNRHQADYYLLCAGSDSPRLARACGLSLPVIPVKGYSLTVDCSGEGRMIRLPIIDRDRHIAVVPLEGDRVRIVGFAEFAGHDTRIPAARIAHLGALLAQILPWCSKLLRTSRATPWTGLRPMCADGTPIIGATPIRNLHLNTGHSQLGLTLAAGSGRLAADLLLGRRPLLAPEPYSSLR